MEIEREGTESPAPGSWPGDFLVLGAAAGVSVLLMFLLWEAVELVFATSDAVAHRLHYARGISSSLVAATVIGWISYLQHLRRAGGLEREVMRRTKELNEARALLQLIVDTTPASLVLLDRRLNVVQANRSAEHVHGGALTGRRCFEALAGREDMCEECPALDSFDGGESQRLYGRRRDPRTGEVLEIECHPLSLEDGESYMLLVERIVTEQKKLEARLLHQEKMAAFGLLAAEVAHDMGNPLSSIDLQLQLLDGRKLPEETAAVVGAVRDEVRRLHRILREIVDFARRRRDEASLVSVQSVVEDALRLLRHDRRMRSMKLVEQFDAETPSVFMVEDHLMQVVLNLLINAVDAMHEGGTLRIELRPTRDAVALRIHDTGVGMEPDVLRECLEPLFTTKEQGKGTGLGLSISKDILEAAGGGIELFSAPSKGTTVVVTLPAAEPVPEEAPILSATTAT